MLAAPAWLRNLAGAWVFYSILPGFPQLQPRFDRIARFAPWIGLVIAGMQAMVWRILQSLGWPPLAMVLVVIIVAVWLTGGLHLDGVMDTADGLAVAPDRRLDAMEDSRVGASGVLALVAVLLLQVAALVSLAGQSLGLIPWALSAAAFWGRCSPLWAVLRFPYIKSDGTAGFHSRHARGAREFVPSLVLLLTAAPLLWGMGHGLLVAQLCLIGSVTAALVAEVLGCRLGGHTGDSYGAAVVWTETFTLLLLALSLPWLVPSAV